MKKMDTQIQTPTKQRYPTKYTLKEEILQIINENFIEMLLDMVNQNVKGTQKIPRQQK
jgi:hypothetical protein